MTNKLLDYEKRLFSYRMELDKLIRIQNSSPNKSKHIALKIDYLKQELAYINNQLDLLKADLNVDTATDNTEQLQPSQAAVGTITPPANTIKQSNAYAPYYADTETDSTSASKSTVAKDFENLFGKNLMGIFASLLIFISFIVFAAVILPNLTDGIKLFAMYSISFAFLGLGIFLQNKDASNKLYLSISGCGVGAIYISILLSNIYFNVVGDITMYILIFFWALFVCHMSCTKSYIFQIIGQIGIAISILFGSVLCCGQDDWTKLTFLVIFFITTQSIFLISHYEEEFVENIVNVIGCTICMIILTVALSGTVEAGEYIIMLGISRLLMITYSFCQLCLGYFKFKISERSHALYTYSNIIFYFLIATLLNFSVNPILLIILSSVSLILIEYRFKGNKLNVLRGFYAFTLIINMYNLQDLEIFDFIMEYASFALLVVPFALYGFHAKDKLYKTFSMIYFALFIFDLSIGADNFCINEISAIVLGAGIICMYAYLLKEKDYSTNAKNYLYAITLIYIFRNTTSITEYLNISYDTSNFIILTLVAIAHALAVKSPFGKNWKDKSEEEQFIVLSGIVNIILMGSSLQLIDGIEGSGLHFATILIALMLFFINSKNLLDKQEMGWGLYVGIKFTVLMIYILNSFNAPDFTTSIFCLLLAILSIGIGFVFKYKSLRVYGLGLSLLSIAKLILVDMSYEDSLSRAISYFVCGILCFVISLIYNYVDKKLQQ